jgi:hypothetical protein
MEQYRHRVTGTQFLPAAKHVSIWSLTASGSPLLMSIWSLPEAEWRNLIGQFVNYMSGYAHQATIKPADFRCFFAPDIQLTNNQDVFPSD